jgi:hypothetical protein
MWSLVGQTKLKWWGSNVMHETDDEAPKKEVENGVRWALPKDASRYQMSIFYQLTNYGQMLNVIVHSSFFHSLTLRTYPLHIVIHVEKSFSTAFKKLRKQCYYPFTLHPVTYLSLSHIVLLATMGAMSPLRDWLGADFPRSHARYPT